MSLFKKSVLQVVRNIKNGFVLSYKEVATKARFPNSQRAVGTLMSKNRNLNIPCHRVIKSDGTLGGYNNGGIKQKQKLLKKEGIRIISNKVVK